MPTKVPHIGQYSLKLKKKHYVTRKMHDLLKICVIKYNAKNVLR